MLLESAVPGRLDDRVRDRIVDESRGNPLALLELPLALSATELAGGYRRPDTGPLASQIEQSFLRRIRVLPVETRRLLLTAAAEPIGDVALLRRAADQLGIAGDAAIEAEAAGLIDVGTRVRFRHPLVRSAAYRAGTLDERQLVHGALAEATDPAGSPTAVRGIGPTPPSRPTTPSPPSSSVRPTPRRRGADWLPPAPSWRGPPS